MGLSVAQIAVRGQGIGSSEIAALVGLDDSTTPLDVFLRKAYGVEKPRSAEMNYGHHAEPGILSYRQEELRARRWGAEDFAQCFGNRVLAWGDEAKTVTIRGEESPVVIDSPDAIFEFEGEEEGSVELQIEEAKFVSWHQAYEWGEADGDAPANYQIQCQWHMGATGIHRAELVAELGAPPSPWFVPFQPKVYENLVIVAERFWHDNVLKKVKPVELDASDAAAEYLRQRFPRELHGVLPNAPPEVEALATSYAWLTEQEGALDAEKKTTRNRLCELIGDTAGAYLSDGRKVTWLWQPNGNKAPTRVLRVSKARK